MFPSDFPRRSAAIFFSIMVLLSSTAIAFDRKAAINYGERYWGGDFDPPRYNVKPGSPFTSYSGNGGDCANFISQTLIGGNLRFSQATGFDIGPGGTLIRAEELASELLANHGSPPATDYGNPDNLPDNLPLGDPTFMMQGVAGGSLSFMPGTKSHAMQISAHNPLRFTAHTTNRAKFPYNEIVPNTLPGLFLDFLYAIGTHWVRHIHVPTAPIVKHVRLSQSQGGKDTILSEYFYDDDYNPEVKLGEYYAHTYNGLAPSLETAAPAGGGEIRIKVIFDTTMRVESIAASFGTASPFQRYAFETVRWSETHQPFDTWEGRFIIDSAVEGGEHTVSINAQSQDLSSLDSDGDLSKYTPGADTSVKFQIVKTPPSLTLTNEWNQTMVHGSYSDSALIKVDARHRPARVASLEFFIGNSLEKKEDAPSGALDFIMHRRFKENSWHYVRACDVLSNCVYNLFGVFAPGTDPPRPPGPPAPCPGCTQRPNPDPGDPLPPPDDPDDPPDPPWPPRDPLGPKECTGSACIDVCQVRPESCKQSPSWPEDSDGPVEPPDRPKFCERTPQNCRIPIAFPHDPNAKHGPAGSVTPGQTMTYTVEFENEGQGTALETYVRDTLDPALDGATLVLREMRRVNYAAETETPADFPWSYDPRTRTITVQTGDADFRQGGRFIVEARLKADTAPGTFISNQAVVYFPNSLEITPTNSIVSAVPFAVQLAYEGASSATYLAPARLAARLTASGKPLPQQPVELLLAGSSWTVMTDANGVAEVWTSIALLPGSYRLQARYAGDGLLYSAGETSAEFNVFKRAVRLEAPFAAARSTETVRFVVTLVDDEGRPLAAQSEDPKTVHFELLQDGDAVTPLGSALLAGSSVAFEVAVPRPLQVTWSLRARFNGDLRYAAVNNSGVLQLIDQTAPTVAILAPAGGRKYSNSEQVPINFTVQDGEDPAPAAVALLVSTGGHSVSATSGGSVAASALAPGIWRLAVQATDWAVNTTHAQGDAFEVLAVADTLPPRSSIIVSTPQAGTEPLYITSSTLIGVSAVDDLTSAGDAIGTGVARIEYALDGGSTTAFSSDFTISSEGFHSIVYFSADYAGNVEAARTQTLVVDDTPPLTSLLVDGLPAGATQLTLISGSSLSLRAEDAGAGVATTVFSLDGGTPAVYISSFSVAVGTHTLLFYSEDRLGHREDERRVELSARPADAEPPALRLDFPGSAAVGVEQAVGGVVAVRGEVGEDAGVSWTLSAGSATLASGSGPASGLLASWDTTRLSGYQTLTLSASDSYGNAASTTATVFVGKPVFTFAIGRKDSHVIVNKIKNPTGIAVRSDGRIWVAATNEDELLLLTSSGAVVAEVDGDRDHGHGHHGYGHGHGQGHDDDEDDLGFKNPQGLALDAADNLYVADRGNDRVVKLSPDGSQVLLQVAKLDGHGRPKPGSGAGELRHPQDVAVDGNGDIYVADSGNARIQVFDSSGTFLRQFGPGVLLSTSEVRGIALAAEGLWVSDKEQERVFLFSRAGALIKSIGDADSAVGEISRMRGLASDRLGALYVVEPNRDRTQKFDPRGKGLLAFGSKAGLSHADKHAKRYLTQPIDAAIAPDGSIWITDTGRDRIVRYALPVSGGFGVASTGGGEMATSGSVEPARRIVDHKDGARVERDDGAGVHVPKGALSADLEITVDKGDENQDKEEKTAKRKEKKVTAASEEVQYGPEGTVFDVPVTLTLPYDANLVASQGIKEDELKVYYWNPSLKDWQAMPSVVDKKGKTVSAETNHFSGYQVQGPGGAGIGVAAVDDFGFRDMYAFPNPSRNASAVTFRMQPGRADSIEVRVYDLSGRKVHSSSNFRFLGAIDDGNGKGAQNTYDHVWDVSGIGSGVYTFVITAKKAGQSDIRKSGKVAVIR